MAASRAKESDGSGRVSGAECALPEEAGMVGVLARALTYATLFIGFVLVFLPAQVLASAGVRAPADWGAAQFLGMFVCAIGASIAIACVLTFAVLGRGTPAPFDPPRQLVVGGPYRYVRNPMYIGAGLALAGAALFYHSASLLGYALGFLLVMHVFVVVYEEPTLRKTFGESYESYCQRVHRWWPTLNMRQPA
jgi:protein-S-isoprenylcysteine O-methyltransferase Ste14